MYIMNKLESIINDSFQELLRSYKEPNHHVFFDSNDWWKNIMRPSMQKDMIAHFGIDKKVSENIKDIFIYSDAPSLATIEPIAISCKYVPEKVISKDQLIKIYDTIIDPKTTDFSTVKSQLDILFDYNLPSTVPDVKKKTIIKSRPFGDVINVIIVGSGPIGLFTALYLNDYYNRSSNPLNVHINILLLDNRIKEEGVRLPYSRVNQFGFDIQQIQPFFKQIFCWDNKPMSFGTRQFDHIYVLENMLYLSAFTREIPMYFTKKLEDYDAIKQYALKNGFHYIFDCTGGRMKPTFMPHVKWTKFDFKKGNSEVKYIGGNIHTLFVDGTEFKDTVIVLRIMYENMKPLAIGNILAVYDNPDDEKIIKQFRNKCLTVDNYIALSKHFKSDNLRYMFPLIMSIHKLDIEKPEKIKYVMITTFDVNPYHVNQVAKTIDKDLIYVGLGNTLGVSEFGIHFGLKDAIWFAKHVCNLLGTVKYLT